VAAARRGTACRRTGPVAAVRGALTRTRDSPRALHVAAVRHTFGRHP
jgi:hypothetical protein